LLAKKVLIVAVCVSSLLSLALVIPSSAQASKPIIIASGKSTGYNINTTGAAPAKYYTSSPPLMVAAKVGSGAVVAAGIASTCRDNRWNNSDNPGPNLDALLDKAFQWMKPGATKVLWYEGYGVYNTITTSPVQCANLRDALVAKGYTLTGDATTPITASLLAPYDILVIPQLELPITATGTGGDPTLLPDADVQAIVSFVEGGKGLFLMDQSDYAGHNFSNVQNKILDALGAGFYFQDDQAQDDTNKWGQAAYQPIAVIDTTTDIGSAFQSATGKSEIGLYDICSLRIQENYDVSVTILPTVNVAEGGESTTYTATITNIGLKPDNYIVTVGDTLGWLPSLSQTNVSVENGENVDVTVSVTVPTNLTAKIVDWVTVTASGVSGGETENAQVRAINVFVKTGPGFPTVPVGPGFLGPGLPDLTVENSASVVTIVCGIGSGYSNDITPREPQPILYGQGEFPPVSAAAFVDNGRVVVMPNSILRDAYFDRAELSNDEMMSDIVRWIINWENPENNPANGEPYNFTYLVTGPGVYHTNAIVSKYLVMLGDLGFNVSYEADTSVSLPVIITPSLLENVDVLHLNEIDRVLSTDEIQAIVNWVKAGGNLIIGCQADYGGYGLPAYPNAVLEALNVPVRFQDDELYDDNSWVIDGPWYPQVDFLDVRQVNPNFDVWFPAIDFTAGMSVRSLTANNVQVLFPFTITNTGTRSSSYKIEVQETTSVGWDVNVVPTEVSVAPSENIEGYITITVPEIQVGKTRMDLLLTITDQTLTSLSKSITFAALGDNSITISSPIYKDGQSVSNASVGTVTIVNMGYSGGGVGWSYVVQTTGGENKIVSETALSGGGPSQPGGFPKWVIAVVVVIVVVVVGGYFAMRKSSSGKSKAT
jgi:plastocyanin